MTTMIAFLRGVNIGGKNKIKMEELRTVCEAMGLRDARTYIQSGNIVFRSAARDASALLENEIERAFGFRPPVITRTAAELRAVVERNPIRGAKPNQLLVFFLTGTPTAAAVEKVRQMDIQPEELHILGAEMYIHFPLGQGVSKLAMARIEKTLGVTGTGRNWNSVLALLAMAEGTEQLNSASTA